MANRRPETSSRRMPRKRSLSRTFATFLSAAVLGGLSVVGGAIPAVAAPSDLSIAAINFTDIHVGTSNAYTFTLTNNSATDSQDITGLNFASYGESQLTITDDQCATINNLGPGDTCAIVVDFHPTIIESVYQHGINGTLDGAFISGMLRGNTIPSLEALDGLDFDFGQVPVGGEAVRTMLLTNTSGQTVTVNEVVGGAGGATSNRFSRISDCEGEILAPGAKCSLVYSFNPTEVGTFTYDTFTGVGVIGSHFSPTFTGEGVAWALSPTHIDFGHLPLGSTSTHDVTVTNVTSTPQTMPAMSGTYSDPFSFSTLDCTTDIVIQPQESCTVTMKFDAAQVGLQETPDDTALQLGDTRYPVSARALVFSEPNYDMWTMDPLALDFGEVLVGESKTLTSTLTFIGEGTGTFFPKNIDLGGPFDVVSDCVAFAELAVGESCTFSVTFTPAAAGDFTGDDTLRVYGNEFALSASGTGLITDQNPADSEDPADDESQDPSGAKDQALARTDMQGTSGVLGFAVVLSVVGGVLLLRRRSV